ncbi:MAG: hypothetical protein JNN02_05305 [Tabrizicola sp.]|nr:hypothetical protein [Tabrizicola sp.]
MRRRLAYDGSGYVETAYEEPVYEESHGTGGGGSYWIDENGYEICG